MSNEMEDDIDSKIRELEEMKKRLAKMNIGKEKKEIIMEDYVDPAVKTASAPPPPNKQIKINIPRKPLTVPNNLGPDTIVRPEPPQVQNEPEQPQDQNEPEEPEQEPDQQIRLPPPQSYMDQNTPAYILPEKIAQMQLQDQDMVHKRVAAQEVFKWTKMSVNLFAVNIATLFMVYFFMAIYIRVAAEVTLAAVIIFDGYYIVLMRKRQLYLKQRYNIVQPPSLFSNLLKPKQPQQQQRQFQQPPPPLPQQQFQQPPQQFQQPPQQQINVPEPPLNESIPEQKSAIRKFIEKQNRKHYDQGRRSQ